MPTATVFGGTGIPLEPLSSGSIGCGGMPSSTASALKPWFNWIVSCGIVDSVCPRTFSAW